MLALGCSFLTAVWLGTAPAQASEEGFFFRTLHRKTYRASLVEWDLRRDGSDLTVLASGKPLSPAAFAYGSGDFETFRRLNRRNAPIVIGNGLIAGGGVAMAGGAFLFVGIPAFAVLEGTAWVIGAFFNSFQSPWTTVTWGQRWPGVWIEYGAATAAVGLLGVVTGISMRVLGSIGSKKRRDVAYWYDAQAIEAGVERHNEEWRQRTQGALHLDVELELGVGYAGVVARF